MFKSVYFKIYSLASNLNSLWSNAPYAPRLYTPRGIIQPSGCQLSVDRIK